MMTLSGQLIPRLDLNCTADMNNSHLKKNRRKQTGLKTQSW